MLHTSSDLLLPNSPRRSRKCINGGKRQKKREKKNVKGRFVKAGTGRVGENGRQNITRMSCNLAFRSN
jgi:hypothetical protein